MQTNAAARLPVDSSPELLEAVLDALEDEWMEQQFAADAEFEQRSIRAARIRAEFCGHPAGPDFCF